MIIAIKQRFYIMLAGIILLTVSVVVGGIYKFFSIRLHTKLAIIEQEQQLLTEQLNKKLVKLNKNISVTKEENKNLQSFNKELEIKLEDYKYAQQDLHGKLEELINNKLKLEQNYHVEKNNLQKQITTLSKDNTELQLLVKELQQQIQNHKNNSYGLFQAGKLEVELTSLEQELSEHYENITKKQQAIHVLKDKCGKLRINSKFCKEYDATLANITSIEQHIEHLKNKREDLKKRINTYLSMSN